MCMGTWGGMGRGDTGVLGHVGGVWGQRAGVLWGFAGRGALTVAGGSHRGGGCPGVAGAVLQGPAAQRRLPALAPGRGGNPTMPPRHPQPCSHRQHPASPPRPCGGPRCLGTPTSVLPPCCPIPTQDPKRGPGCLGHPPPLPSSPPPQEGTQMPGSFTLSVGLPPSLHHRAHGERAPSLGGDEPVWGGTQLLGCTQL